MRELQAARGATLTDEPGASRTLAEGSDADRTGPTTARGATRAGTGGRRAGLLLLVAALVLGIDAGTKALVVAQLSGHPPLRTLGGAVYLLVLRNSGAAFGIATGSTAVFTLVALAIVVVIVKVAARLRSRPWAVALGLILGGACGNLTDRLARAPGVGRGAVVDWISLASPDGRVWPVFNIADASIVCGGVLAVALVLLGRDVDGRLRRDVGRHPPDDRS